MPSLTADLKPKSPLVKKILTAVQDRVTFSKSKFNALHKKWNAAEDRTVAFLPERALDALRRVDREQLGIPSYTTIQIPYTYAVLMSSHTYWTSVFLGRTPIYQFAGRHGESENKVQALEALMDYQVQVGEHLVPYYIWLLDVGKYGIGILGEFWEEEVSRVSEIVEEPVQLFGIFATGKTRKRRQSRDVPGFQGNKVRNIRPHDFFPDPRVTMAKFQQGEFVAIYSELGWNRVVERVKQGFFIKAAVEALPPGDRGGTVGDRVQGSPRIELPDTDIPFSVTALDKKAADVLKLYECYIELIPSEWKLGKSDMPEKWVFTTTADFAHLLGAQPLGALHNRFPLSVIELEPEGYSILPRGIPEIVEPIQNTLDWLINSHFFNVRKMLNGRYVVDPSKIVMKDLLGNDAGRIIRLRPQAYGSDTKLAISQLEATDVTRSHLTDMQVMLDMGQRTTGVSDPLMGMVNTRGRRTAQEVRSSTTFGINRLKTSIEYFSAMGFAPLSSRMVQNTQQFFDRELQFRIVGDLALEAGPAFADVSADTIAGFYDFVPIDGTLPVDRFAQANLWRELLAGMRQFPELTARYDIARIFGWVAQLAGLKNIHQFLVDGQPDAVLDEQARQGNIVPLGRGTQDLGKVSEPGQVSGLGTSG